MQIISNGERMLALTDTLTVEWYIGSHTANVTSTRGDMDVFTFSWDKNTTHMLDFTSALQNYLDYLEA